MKTKILSILALLLMTVTQGAWAAETTETIATNNRQQSYSGTNVTITVTATGDNDGAQPPFTISTTNGENITQVVLTVGYYYYNAGNATASPGTCSVSGSGNGSTYITVTNINATSLTVSCSNLQIKQAVVTYGTPDPNAGLLTGRFSVSATKQVRFSQGNLQAYFASAGTSCTWRFATNQYDYVGSAAANVSINGNGSVSAAGAVDLFGWVGNSSTVLTGTPAKYGISNSTTASDYGTSTSDALKDDWGNLTITANGSATNLGWRTLTSAEWVYLFNTRTSGSTVNGTSNARFTHATINTDGTSVNGVILFPDGVTIANGEATSWGNVNSNSTWSGSTKCTSAQWTALAAKGCVFLPAAGRRRGATVYGLPSSDANVPFGYYWSSSPNASDQSNADYMYFYSDRVYPGVNGLRYESMSVRLVKDYIFTGLGTEASPYLIASTTDWNNLVSAVNAGETYSGTYFKMTANISVSERTSTSQSNPFSGTFDGGGYTLNLSINETGTDATTAAPFGYVVGGTIKNVNVTGSVQTVKTRPASLVGFAGTNCTILNCKSSAAVSSSLNDPDDGDVDGGAFVACVDGTGTLTITGCTFTGSITYSGGEGYEGGGFVGWMRSGSSATLTDCLFAPTAVSLAKASPDFKMFAYNNTNTTLTLNNCYYNGTAACNDKITKQDGTMQMHTIAAGDYVSALSVTKGNATAPYDVSGITVYSGGIDFNDGSTTTFYGGSGQSVSLELTAATRTGYQFKQYAASQGTLSDQTTNTPTLTMPAANSTANDAVTISAQYDPTYNATFADGIDNNGWSISPTSGIVGSTVTVSYTGENKVKSVTVAPKGALTGKFSVSSTKQVQFSKGNLQYVGTWQFAANQYDIFGASQSDDHRDLFGWGTKTNPNNTSTTNSDYSWAEWGQNTITNGCTGWRTLTKDEWGYLFTDRANASTLRTFATVNSVEGLIVMPDGWTASGVTLTITTANYSTNVLSTSQWATLEKQGCVFLPAAGGRAGTDVVNVGSIGDYWSSDASGETNAYDLNFSSNNLFPQYTGGQRHYGWSVRLVRDVVSGPVAYQDCPNDQHPHWIDLGLSSGTLWQCCNEGATKPEGYGSYYSYNDAQSYNPPTKDQIQELLDNTNSGWTTVNGVYGRWFTSKNNSGKVFLPAAGNVFYGELYDVGTYGNYWSSTPGDLDDSASVLNFDSSDVGCNDGDCSGLVTSVRPVRKN